MGDELGLEWKWEEASRTYNDYGNPIQFTVGGNISSLAREAGQNSNDARLNSHPGELNFTFIPLTGTARTEFEQAIGWNLLSGHLESMASKRQVISAVLRDGLDHVNQADELLLLRIEDRGCAGLTGPEFADVSETEFGNFIKLCRLDLFSGKEEAKGGSFGLGKAVYWRFSRLQTVLFNSHLAEPWDGREVNRLFGVNQGTVHSVSGSRYRGRGYFGEMNGGDVRSTFVDEPTVRSLHIDRPTDAPGTSALIVGFWDPDNPDHTIDEYRRNLESGIEEAFWPLIARGGMRFTVDIEGDAAAPVKVAPERSFTELVHALRTYDQSDESDTITELGDVVVRDVPITVPKRKTEPRHGTFEHTAKLIVTLSDDHKDSLENKVCLVRGPEMVVDMIEEEFPGVTYHAVLLAGLAVDPGSTDQNLRLADDFLRIAEPPSHDKWIPTSRGAPQTSLAANYIAPYLKNLKDIQTAVKTELRDLFGIVVKADDRPPEAIMRHLRFLRGPKPPDRVGKPNINVETAQVVDGRWILTATATARNRPEGWTFRPDAFFVGIEGGAVVRWETLDPVKDCSIRDGWVYMTGRESGRTLRATFRGETNPESHPIPAGRSAVDIRASQPGPNPETAS